MSGPRTVSGVVHLLAAAPPGAVLTVRLEDVSRLDAAAPVLASTTVALPEGAAAHAEIPFALGLSAHDPEARYNLRAHVAATGAAEIRAGDLLSTRAHPLPPEDRPAALRIEAQPI